MKKLLSIFTFFSATIIIAFLLFSDAEETINIELEHQENILTYVGLSFAFLVADIVLPIPSSLVMILNGKVLGFGGGAMLSLVSSLLSSTIGFYIGRTTAKGFNRFFSEKEIKQGNLLFERFSDLSIVVSKAIPVLSECVSCLSGNTSISFKRFLFYSIMGHLIVSVIYAFVGSYASSLNSFLISGGVILGTTGLFFVFKILVGKKLGQL